MDIQGTFHGKAFATHVTYVRLVSCMGPLVGLETTTLTKTVATYITFILFLPLVNSQLMHFQTAPSRKTLLARCALERPFACVYTLMFYYVAPSGKALSTLATAEHFFSFVDNFSVCSEATFSRECLFA